MQHILAENLKKLRKKRGLSQKDLARGICTQAMVSLFETGDSVPSSIILFQLANRLEVKMDTLFQQEQCFESEYMERQIKFIRQAVEKQDYSLVHHLIVHDLEKIEEFTISYQQFLRWNDALCDHFLSKNSPLAISKAKQAIGLTENNLLTDQLANVYNSLANIYCDMEAYTEAESIYQHLEGRLEAHSNFIQSETFIRIYLNVSRNLTALEKYNEALIYAYKGYNLSIEKNCLKYLGSLLFQIGRIHIFMESNEQAVIYLNQAKIIFQLQRKDHFLTITQQLLAHVDK